MGFNLANMGYAAMGMSAAAHDNQSRRSQMLQNEGAAVNVRAAQGKETSDAEHLARLRALQNPGFRPPPVASGRYNIGEAPAAAPRAPAWGDMDSGPGAYPTGAQPAPIAGAPAPRNTSNAGDGSWDRVENYRNERIGKATSRNPPPPASARTAANARGLADLRQSRGLGTGEEFGAGSGSGGPKGDNINPSGYWTPEFQARNERFQNAPPGTKMFSPLDMIPAGAQTLPERSASAFDQQFPAPGRPIGMRIGPVPGTTAPAQGGASVVTPGLIKSIGRTENSTGNPMAVSPKGAIGPMQVMPGTFADMSKTYFNGALDPKNAEHQQLAGEAYLHHLATVELPRRGIPVTQENVISAYQQGAGGLSKNGISANITDGITNNRAYTDKVLKGVGTQPAGLTPPTAQPGAPGAQPAPPAAPAPAAAPAPSQYPTQGVQFVGGQGQNHDIADLERQHAQLQAMIDTSRDPAQVSQAMTQQTMLRAAARESHVMQLGHAAGMGNPQALNEVLALYSRGVGQPLGITHAGNGQYVLVNEQGKPLIPPQALSAITSAMTSHLSSTIRAQNAEQAKAMGMSYAQAKGKSQGELQADLAKLQQTGANMLNVQELAKNSDFIQMLAKNNLDAGQVQSAVIDPNGGIYITTKNGYITHVAGGSADPKTGAMPGLMTRGVATR